MISKNYLLDSINIGERRIFPIASLNIVFLKNTFFSYDFKVVAFKIIEKDLIYFINLDLSDEEFENIGSVENLALSKVWVILKYSLPTEGNILFQHYLFFIQQL